MTRSKGKLQKTTMAENKVYEATEQFGISVQAINEQKTLVHPAVKHLGLHEDEEDVSDES